MRSRLACPLYNLIELPALKAVYRSFGVALIVFFVAVSWLALEYFEGAASGDSLAEYANGFVLGAAALVTLVIAQQHPPRSVARVFWWCWRWALSS